VDRCALFVDAGYALGDGALAVHGTRHRDSVTWDYAGLLKLLAELSRDRSGLPVLRCYWYEATVDSRRTAEHETLADIPGLKLRLGKVRPGRREGVETEIRRDLTTLARNKAVSDVIIVSAEEDLAQVISDVQDQGLRVAILHIAADGDWTVSRALRQECDDIIEISAAHLRPYVDLITGAEPAVSDNGSPAAGYPDREPSSRSSAPPAPQPASVATGSVPPSPYPVPVAAEYPRTAPSQSGSGQAAAHSPLHDLFSSSPASDQPGADRVGSARAPSAGAPGTGDNAVAGNVSAGNVSAGNTGAGSATAGHVGAASASAASASAASGTDASGVAPAGRSGSGAASPGSAIPRAGGSAAGAAGADASRPGSPSAGTADGLLGGTTRGRGEDLGAGSGLRGGQQGQDMSRGIMAGSDSAELGRQDSGLGQPPVGDQPRMPAQQQYQGLEPIRGSLPSPGQQPGQGQPGLPHGGMSQGGTSQNGAPQGAMPMYGHNGQNGQPQNGLPQNGLPQNGLPQNGLPRNGLPQNGMSQNGMSQGGMSQGGQQHGLPQNGLPDNGIPQGGMSQNGQQPNRLPHGGTSQNGLPQNGLPQGEMSPNGLPPSQTGPQGGAVPHSGMPQNGLSQNGLSQHGLGQNGLGQSGQGQSSQGQGGQGQGGQGQGGFTQRSVPPQHSVPPQGSGTGEFPRGGGLPQHGQSGPPQHGLPPVTPDSQRSIPPQRQLPAGQQYPPAATAPYSQPQQPQQPAPYVGGYGPAVPQQGPSYPQPSSPYGSLQPGANQPSMPQPIAISLADAVQAAHAEGFGFGEAVARDAPALWLEAVLARKPRMPSDLEARLLQGSALPIDSLLHDEVRHALRRGFWDALERSRR
jgi:hypothetical protein